MPRDDSGAAGAERRIAVTPHKFRNGQTVILMTRRYEETPSGTFTIVRAMPTEHGVKQYRVRSNFDGHERIVGEADLQ